MISIIIPAHNEEKYIAETLENLKKLSFPKDSFEVLVIENGSDDKTFEVAKKFEDENIKVYQSEKGVSKAKNFGIEHVSKNSEWIIFLDADTILKPNFLNKFFDFIAKNKTKNFAIGTTSVKPLEKTTLYGRLWMKFYDFGHKYTKTSFAIQIMNASLKEKVKFDETLYLAEDLKFIKDCLVFGNFFYFDTDDVLTSIRRFEKTGWFRLFLKWNYDAMVWRVKENYKPHYPVIR